MNKLIDAFCAKADGFGWILFGIFALAVLRFTYFFFLRLVRQLTYLIRGYPAAEVKLDSIEED